MSAILATVLKIFRRKKPAPLACTISLDDAGQPIGTPFFHDIDSKPVLIRYPSADDPSHVHTSACFIPFSALTVVELFQSQSCSACPPAVPAILSATMNPNVLLLTYNVTIFDHLGWKDTLANTGSDQRQRAYVKRWQRNSLFTPQVVVNGIVDGNGSGGENEIMDLTSRAQAIGQAMDWHIYLDANDSEIRIDSDRSEAQSHDILVVLYRSGEEVVKVGKGPNKGIKLRHRNVVKQVTKIGEWTGGNQVLALPTARGSMKAGEEAVVLVQDGSGGAIVAAVKI
jgi:hypothetical protein